MTQTVLMVIDKAPYGDWQGREILDMALSLAAFDRPVALLFRGEGVNWLRPEQNGSLLRQKTVSRNLGAAKMFGVEEIYADQDALTRFQVSSTSPATQSVDVRSGFYQEFAQVVQL